MVSENSSHETKKNWLFRIVLVLFVVSVFYAVYMLFQAPAGQAENKFERVKTDYILMILQCIGGVVVLFLPAQVEKRFNINIPDQMEIMYFLFLFCAVFLGEVTNFYHLIPFWDMILHGFSAAMLGILGFIIVRYLNGAEGLDLGLTPFFVALFAFSFAMTAGMFWEIYEFSMDGIFGTNMQKYITAENNVLIGRDALVDTMKDFIVNAIGALITTSVGYMMLKKKETVKLSAESDGESEEAEVTH